MKRTWIKYVTKDLGNGKRQLYMSDETFNVNKKTSFYFYVDEIVIDLKDKTKTVISIK